MKEGRNHMSNNVIQAIQENLTRLTKHKEFVNRKLEEEPLAKSDLVVINNSFLHRGVSTNKDDKYLVYEVAENGNFEPSPKIATLGTKVNKDIKKFKAKSKNIQLMSLKDVVKQELAELAGCRRDKRNDKVQGFAGLKPGLHAVKKA